MGRENFVEPLPSLVNVEQLGDAWLFCSRFDEAARLLGRRSRGGLFRSLRGFHISLVVKSECHSQAWCLESKPILGLKRIVGVPVLADPVAFLLQELHLYF